MRPSKHVKITNKGYGRRWMRFKVFYIGPRPKMLRLDGAFTSGKTILETLAATFPKFELILWNRKSKLEKVGKTVRIFLSTTDVRSVNSRLIARKKDVTQSAISAKFAELFPEHFAEGTRLFAYENGLLAGVFTDTFPPTRLTVEDRQALNNFIPRFVASGVASTGSASSDVIAGFEVKILRNLAADLEVRIKNDKSESTWQQYLRQNITRIQQGYIELVPKANIDVVGTSYPDFLLVTHDGYLDILEIKTPATKLLLHDESHNNYYWSGEISKAVAQVENYIHAIIEIADKVRNRVKDRFGIELRVIKPRGIIFAGHSEQFGGNKLIQDDFRILNEGLKNLTLVTYDELLVRLQNYISALTVVKKAESESMLGRRKSLRSC